MINRRDLLKQSGIVLSAAPLFPLCKLFNTEEEQWSEQQINEYVKKEIIRTTHLKYVQTSDCTIHSYSDKDVGCYVGLNNKINKKDVDELVRTLRNKINKEYSDMSFFYDIIIGRVIDDKCPLENILYACLGLGYIDYNLKNAKFIHINKRISPKDKNVHNVFLHNIKENTTDKIWVLCNLPLKNISNEINSLHETCVDTFGNSTKSECVVILYNNAYGAICFDSDKYVFNGWQKGRLGGSFAKGLDK